MTIRDTTSGKPITLECSRLLRRIEGRRSVYEGQYDGKPVIVKRFTSAFQGKHHYSKEINGLKELTLRHIKTAQIAAAGQDEYEDYVIALEKIEPATDVFALLERPAASVDVESVLTAVIVMIARMHEAGVVQQDLHTGNFLWDGEAVYVLDPAKMSFSHHPLDETASFDQLGIFLASLPELEWMNSDALLRRYFEARGWPYDSSKGAQIDTLTEAQRLSRMRRTLRKTLRTSKRHIQFKRGSCQGVFCRELFTEPEMTDLPAWIDREMETGQVLKRGNTCFVSRIQINGLDVVVKRYNHKSLWHSLRHTIKGSRARKCWLFGHRLRELGIATARPLGFFEHCRFGLVWQSYIFNAYVEGANIADYSGTPDISDGLKKDVSEKTRQMLAKLIHFRITHGDLKPGNILIHRNRPVLIDLDSMKRHRCGWMLRLYERKMDDMINERNVLWKT